MDRRTFLKLLAAAGVAPSALSLASCTPKPAPITTPGDRHFEHPRSESELVALVNRARERRTQLRVRGSLHSHGAAIFADRGEGNVDVQLDRYNRVVEWDDARMRVTVQAGIHLGVDPHDPRSTRDDSLLYQLEARGWALPDLGGITHQTVGGFLSTGSAGGTTRYDVGEAVVAIRIVAGNGNVYVLEPNPDDPQDALTNPFYAAGVSMGLLGIISTVTFQCVPRYDIIGKQVTTSTADCFVDLFGNGERSLQRWMEGETYNRLLLWPQHGVDKVQLWSARRTTEADRPRTHSDGAFRPRKFRSVEKVLGSEKVAQSLVYHIYSHVDRKAPPYDEGTVETMRFVLNEFLQDKTDEFWDTWLEGLPMDNQISDDLMPTEFTELFIDIDRTADVMARLKEFYAGDVRMGRTGPYANEIYPSKASPFWLSPSHGKNQVRVDIFWFKSGRTNPAEVFYPQYWELLSDFGFRPHWGKHLPPAESSTGLAYRRALLPMWQSFMITRERLDPDQVFVTDYWRKHLGIEPPRPALGTPSAA